MNNLLLDIGETQLDDVRHCLADTLLRHYLEKIPAGGLNWLIREVRRWVQEFSPETPLLDLDDEVEEPPQKQTPKSEDRSVPSSGTSIEKNVFRKDGDSWHIVYEGQRLPPLKPLDGFLYIAYLLQYPHKPIPISTLRALKERQQPDPRYQPYEKMSQEQLSEEGLNVSPLGDTGTGPDRPTIAQVRARKAEIEGELKAMDEDPAYLPDPDKWPGEDRVEVREKLEEERKKLTEYLSAGTRLGGRPRKAAAQAERDRTAVTKAIDAAIARIKEKNEALGSHLHRCIDTGNTCMYRPDKSTSWSL